MSHPPAPTYRILVINAGVQSYLRHGLTERRFDTIEEARREASRRNSIATERGIPMYYEAEAVT